MRNLSKIESTLYFTFKFPKLRMIFVTKTLHKILFLDENPFFDWHKVHDRCTKNIYQKKEEFAVFWTLSACDSMMLTTIAICKTSKEFILHTRWELRSHPLAFVVQSASPIVTVATENFPIFRPIRHPLHGTHTARRPTLFSSKIALAILSINSIDPPNI